jgi:hypothetical protein
MKIRIEIQKLCSAYSGGLCISSGDACTNLIPPQCEEKLIKDLKELLRKEFPYSDNKETKGGTGMINNEIMDIIERSCSYLENKELKLRKLCHTPECPWPRICPEMHSECSKLLNTRTALAWYAANTTQNVIEILDCGDNTLLDMILSTLQSAERILCVLYLVTRFHDQDIAGILVEIRNDISYLRNELTEAKEDKQ